jgi:hypothetical protein
MKKIIKQGREMDELCISAYLSTASGNLARDRETRDFLSPDLLGFIYNVMKLQ